MQGQAYGLVEEIMRPCKCEVPGRFFSRCDDPLHTQALDYRSGCYDALDKLEQARRDAEWALELYPHRLEAYLRFGKVARRQGNHMLAWQIYCAGVQIGRRAGMANDDRFKVRYFTSILLFPLAPFAEALCLGLLVLQADPNR